MQLSFDTFVNSLVIAYIRHDFMRDEITASGINLDELPERSLARGVWLSYKAKLETMSAELAAHEMENNCDILERFSVPLNEIPRNVSVLNEKYRKLFEQYQIEELAKKLNASPEHGRELIKDFQLGLAKDVGAQSLSDLSMLIDEHIEKVKGGKAVVKIKKYPMLSEMIGGFNPERLGIFLGGTGFGKTNFAINLAVSAAETMRVAYVNMEMGFDDMVKRFAVIACGVSYLDYARGSFNSDDVKNRFSNIGDKIVLTPGRTLSFDQIESWIRLAHNQSPIGLVIIDYDQRVELNSSRPLEEWKMLQKMIEAFEDMSKEMGLYVMILAQVNRDGLISGSHRSQFAAHTVLVFHEHEDLGPIIEARKNRHGKKSQALQVLYNQENSQIIETAITTITKSAAPKLEAKNTKQKNQWWTE